MTGTREIKMRIRSIKEILQITRAMKVISAAKLKKARKQLDQTLPYFSKVFTTIADILANSQGLNTVYFDPRSEKPQRKRGYLLITGDKGMAGGYNHNIIKITEEELLNYPDSELFVMGSVGRSYFLRKNYNVNPDFFYPVQMPTIYRAREIAEILLENFRSGALDEVCIIYTKAHSTLRQEPHIVKVLPLDVESLLKEARDFSGDRAVVPGAGVEMIYEPSPEVVFDVLVAKYLKGIVYGCMVESFTSEQSARMLAMESATANAEEMLEKLHLSYNRARQGAITREISEIISGVNALE